MNKISICLILIALGGGVFFILKGQKVQSQELPRELPGNYEMREGCAKQTYLWNERILPTRHRTLPPMEEFGKSETAELLLQDLGPKLNHRSDLAPRGWKKLLHAVGVVGKVEFVPEPGSPYSGLYQGVSCGLIRLSLTYRPDDDKVAPGLALKFFINYQPSVNFSALISLEPQVGNYNFFSGTFSNIVPEWGNIGARIIAGIFKTVAKYPQRVELDEMGGQLESGESVNWVHGPRQLFLKPTAEVQPLSQPSRDFRRDLLDNLSNGMTLFDVYAVSESRRNFDYENYNHYLREQFSRESRIIGRIVLRSSMVASEFGDKDLFFRHQAVPKD